MAILPDALAQLALKFEVLLPHLNERQQRLLLAAEAWAAPRFPDN